MRHLSTATKLFAAVALASVCAQAQIATSAFNSSKIKGFGSDGTGWQVNNLNISSTAVTSDVLTLTDNGANQARCVFKNIQARFQSGFSASYVYTASGGKTADGIGFVIQNNGVTSRGNSGSGIGYETIPQSLAVEFSIYGGSQVNVSTNGVTGGYNNSAPVVLGSGHPILITVNYSQKTQILKYTYFDQTTSDTYTNSVSSIDLKTLLGGRSGYVGFCGGTGGSTAIQTVSNFSFSTF